MLIYKIIEGNILSDRNRVIKNEASAVIRIVCSLMLGWRLKGGGLPQVLFCWLEVPMNKSTAPSFLPLLSSLSTFIPTCRARFS